jgi:hypothetical protein
VNPTLPIEKSEPVTESERYLHHLCNKTFLSLWTYPGVYRDQGKRSEEGDGKEVCDVVIVFKKHVILFSDKSCQFVESGNWAIDWQRWYKKAIKKSADQLWGAERWFREFPERLYLDRACTRPFPIALPSPSEMQVHRLAVARGAAESCTKYFGGGSGSLMLCSTSSERILVEEGRAMPAFTVADLNPDRGYIHVFDEVTLDAALGTLDTVADFVDYLTKKERFVRSPFFVTAAGEEELLAFYLQSWTLGGEPGFRTVKNPELGWIANPIPIGLGEGGWVQLTDSIDWQALEAWRKPSFYWDFLIERFSQETIAGTIIGSPDTSPRTQETVLRVLAAEPRHRRRMLAAALLGQIERAPEDAILDRSARVIPAAIPEEPTYVFVVVGREEREPEQAYRERRRELLRLYALVAKERYPIARYILALGVDARDITARTEDLVLFDVQEWTSEMAEDARLVRKEGNVLKKVSHTPRFPEPRYYLHAKAMREIDESISDIKVGRNETCPCGSGKKFKRCHGRQY